VSGLAAVAGIAGLTRLGTGQYVDLCGDEQRFEFERSEKKLSSGVGE
jgi:hypothetical protein